MKLYLSLPDDCLPAELFDSDVPIAVGDLSFSVVTGRAEIIEVERTGFQPEVRIYGLDTPVDDVARRYQDIVREVLTLRAHLAIMAMRLGYSAEIPTPDNGLGWTALSERISGRVEKLRCHVSARLDEILGEGLASHSSLSDVGTKKGH